ncbi:MAG: hypothetical protein U0326_42920 [Polyangiales bacterium]
MTASVGPATGAVFELVDHDARSHDALSEGAWSVVEGPEEAVAFDVTSAPMEPPVVWRVRVASASASASASIEAEAERASRVDEGLTTATDRAKRVIAAKEGALEGLSFSLESSAPVSEAERGLADHLEGQVSFAAEKDAEPEGGIAGFLDNLWRRATRVARVETTVGDREVASTDVSLLGEVTTSMRRDATPDEAKLHHRALEATLRTRRSWARIVIQTLQIALALSTGNVLAALPAAWRFVRSVMAEVKSLERAEAA